MEDVVRQIENAFDAVNQELKSIQLCKRDKILAEQIFLRERARRVNE